MKKSLLLSSAAILLFGMTQNFDGQERSQSHRQLPGGGNTGIERQSKMAQAPFFSRQGPNRWTTDHTLPYRHRMTNPLGQRDYRANATITGKTLTQHELSAGVDTAWVRHYASGLAPSLDDAVAIAVDGSGNIYVTGRTVGFPSGYDYLTVKYNASGIQLWTARYDGPGYNFDFVTDLAVDASGNVYVTGTSGVDSFEHDYVTVKYNSDGVEQWVVRYNGPENGYDWATALCLDASGNIYVTGSSYNQITGYDYATVKYNSDGIEQWVAYYNGPGNSWDEVKDIALDASGNVYVTGWGAGLTTIKYDPDGTEQWFAHYLVPGGYLTGATYIALDNYGNVYVTCSSGVFAEGDWQYDWYIFTTIKYVQTPSVSVEKEEPGKPSHIWLLQNYPNPFNPSTTIEFALPKSSFVTLKIYDLLGNEVATLVAEKLLAGKHQRVWEANGLASGVYLYRMQVGGPSAGSGQGFVQTKKLILMR